MEIQSITTIKKFLFSQLDCITKKFLNKKISHDDIAILMGDDVYSYQYMGILEDSSDIVVKDDFGSLVAYRVNDVKYCSYQDNITHVHITINVNSCDLDILKQYELQRLNKALIMSGMRNELVKNQMRMNRKCNRCKAKYKRKRRDYYDKY